MTSQPQPEAATNAEAVAWITLPRSVLAPLAEASIRARQQSTRFKHAGMHELSPEASPGWGIKRKHLDAVRAALAEPASPPATVPQVSEAQVEAVAKDLLAHLVAAVSLLERGGKQAAPSDRMFEQMLVDYKASIERGRAAVAALTALETQP
jgi:hypothetical protein